MGMFDSFYFKEGVLPENREKEDTEFQTKDFNCELDDYYIDSDGSIRVVRFYGDNDEIDDGIYEVYSMRWEPDINDDDAKFFEQRYRIKIRDGRVINAKKYYEEGYEE
jgi:hypothetical protein